MFEIMCQAYEESIDFNLTSIHAGIELNKSAFVEKNAGKRGSIILDRISIRWCWYIDFINGAIALMRNRMYCCVELTFEVC